jgi:hypothetical protein
MKHACPSCRAAGISALAKRWSARECPAACALCGGLSHVLASTSSGIFVGTILVFIVGAWRRAEMFPIPKENAQAAAAVGWFLAGLSGLFTLFS